MKLSVIVPVYNVEYYLPACLNSILPVLESEDELFLIQGKSTDQSRQVKKSGSLRSFSREREIQAPTWEGGT